MRRLSASIVVFCSVVGAAGLQQDEKPRTFSVSGYGKVFYDADMCDLVVGVVTEDENVVACRDAHEAKLRAITDYMGEYEPDDVIFGTVGTGLSIQKQARRKASDAEEHYVYRTQYSIRLKDVTRIATLQSDLVGHGVNEIVKVELLSDELPTLTDDARRLAISDARDKARLAAEELGWTLGPAVNINFQEWGVRSPTFGSRANAGGGRPNASAAEVFVDAGVSITFEFDHRPEG
jgi:uncharacterized protein YggE